MPRRLSAWMDERFPPVTYTALVAVFGMAGLSVGWATGGENWGLAALPVVWLFFLHLRVLDEHKDFANDVIAYPDRVLSRGVVTLSLLARVGAAAVVVQLLLSISLGIPASLAFAGSLLFSFAMFVEFGVGRWLSKHLVLYALTHNPVMVGLAVLVIVATGSPLSAVHAGFIAFSCVAMLGFEFGRKIRLPEEEHPGVPSYTSELGQGRARALLTLTHLGSAAALVWLLWSLSVPTVMIAVAALAVTAPGVATSVGRQRAKRVELGASLVLLVGLVTMSVMTSVTP